MKQEETTRITKLKKQRKQLEEIYAIARQLKTVRLGNETFTADEIKEMIKDIDIELTAEFSQTKLRII